ncbi:hypothetical protein M5K25_027137 [Dendrobium thyrsiflorum]|uniref:Uncharacterized protein n=1 Tax=Dendrobium thyrsiflorum TaxID=117978 RepID=A0ABD0TZJ0_DENTH
MKEKASAEGEVLDATKQKLEDPQAETVVLTLDLGSKTDVLFTYIIAQIKPYKPDSPPCMADPEHNHGFVYDVHGRTDLLRSPFFDLNLEVDDTVDDYVYRILFTLVPSIEEHLPIRHRRLIGRPPTSPPATSPASCTITFDIKHNQARYMYFRKADELVLSN